MFDLIIILILCIPKCFCFGKYCDIRHHSLRRTCSICYPYPGDKSAGCYILYHFSSLPYLAIVSYKLNAVAWIDRRRAKVTFLEPHVCFVVRKFPHTIAKKEGEGRNNMRVKSVSACDWIKCFHEKAHAWRTSHSGTD